MGKIVKRLWVAFCGLVIFLIVLEVVLRLIGSSYVKMSESGGEEPAECGSTILAVGDSVTFGIGAPRGYSYPAQLQKMLREQQGEEGCFTVINRGRPGQNSAQILEMLESWLQDFQPDVVTVLIGARNQVNYYGYQNYLAKREIHPSRWLQLHGYLEKIKVYKLARLLLLDVQNKGKTNNLQPNPVMEAEEEQLPEQNSRKLEAGLYEDDSSPENMRGNCSIGVEYREQGEWEKSHELLLQRATEGMLPAPCYNMIGSVFREQNQPDLAIPWFTKGVEQDPDLYDNYEEIGAIYVEKGQLQEALEWFKRGLGKADPTLLHDQSYLSISLAFREAGKIQEAAKFFEQEKQRLEGKNPKLATLVGDYQLMFSENIDTATIHDWIMSDLEKIVDLCRKYQARVILQNYPDEPKVNHLFKQVASNKGTFFVDQQHSFENYIKDGLRDPEVFVPDGHPNTKGYRMMAENLFRVFVGENVFN